MHVYVSVAPTLAMCQKLLIEIDLDANCIVPEEEFVFTAGLTQKLANMNTSAKYTVSVNTFTHLNIVSKTIWFLVQRQRGQTCCSLPFYTLKFMSEN